MATRHDNPAMWRHEPPRACDLIAPTLGSAELDVLWLAAAMGLAPVVDGEVPDLDAINIQFALAQQYWSNEHIALRCDADPDAESLDGEWTFPEMKAAVILHPLDGGVAASDWQGWRPMAIHVITPDGWVCQTGQLRPFTPASLAISLLLGRLREAGGSKEYGPAPKLDYEWIPRQPRRGQRRRRR